MCDISDVYFPISEKLYLCREKGIEINHDIGDVALVNSKY